MSQWIQDAKRLVTVEQVAQWLGMTRRLKSWGPCPACRAETRSRSDKRSPVGIDDDGGWKCHACQAKGDAIRLAVYGVLDCDDPKAVDDEGWKTLREWFGNQGVDTSSAANPGRSNRAPTRNVSALMKGILGDSKKETRERPRREREAPKTKPGLYGFEPGLAEACEKALWSDMPEAEVARSYLMGTRKLTELALKTFRVGLYVLPDGTAFSDNGRPVLVLPSINEQEEVVSVKYRSVPVVGTCQECSSEHGCKKCRNYRNPGGIEVPLYGVQHLSMDLGLPVVVVEGEMDVLAAYSYGFTVNIVGVPGAGTLHEEWLDTLEPYETTVGLFDMDATGDEGWQKWVDKLGAYRCSRAEIPKNDLNQCLMDGVSREVIERALNQAKPEHGIAMRKPVEFRNQLEVLVNEPWRLKGAPTGWDGVDRIMAGWRPGVIIGTGETGEGKTTFFTSATLYQARQGAGVMFTSFEQEPIGTVQKLLRNEIGGDFTKVKPETRAAALESLSELPLWILDHYGHITPSKLVETMRYAKRRHGVTFFLVDHLGFLLDSEIEDERRAIEAVVRSLAIVAKQMQIVIFLIAHPKDPGQDGHGKAVKVDMRHLKGATAIRQDADDIIVVSKILPSKKTPWPRSEIRAPKVRSDFGVSGGSCVLAFDPSSNVYADRWEDTPAGRDGLLIPPTE